jgi:hypothetical protein
MKILSFEDGMLLIRKAYIDAVLLIICKYNTPRGKGALGTSHVKVMTTLALIGTPPRPRGTRVRIEYAGV